MELTTVQTALETILNQAQDFGVEEVPFDQSLGRILKESVFADRDFPPFNRVSMDGISIVFEQFEMGQKVFPIEGIQPAGSEQLTLQDSKQCIEVMTGAVLPQNANVVIPYELVSIEKGIATITIESVRYFQNIHQQGKDKQQGSILIEENTLISSAEIGVLTTIGKSTVKVAKNPKVMIVSTGDELVEVDQTPADYQIRRSNIHTLVAILKNHKIQADTAHIVDDKEALKEKVASFINKYDVLLFSGAVSKGKFDFIPEILDELGVQKLFHKVAQRPGKPFWFGRVKSSIGSEQDVYLNGKNRNTIVFAFPGNPISTFVSCLKYFVPWYQKSVGIDFQNTNFALLAEDVNFRPKMTYFLQVRLENKKGVIHAFPIRGNGSGDLANLVETDGFIELPADTTAFEKGEVFPVLQYRRS